MTPFAAVLHHPTIEALAHARAPVASAVPMAISQHVARVNTLPCIGINLAWLACLACEARGAEIIRSDTAVMPAPSIHAFTLPCVPSASAMPVACTENVAHINAVPGVGIDFALIACLPCEARRTRGETRRAVFTAMILR